MIYNIIKKIAQIFRHIKTIVVLTENEQSSFLKNSQNEHFTFVSKNHRLL